jgi:hypothetical protein
VNLSGITQGIKSFGRSVAGDVLSGANAAERGLSDAYSSLTGRPGTQGAGTFNLAAKLGLVKDSAPGTQAMLTPANSLFSTFIAPTAYSDRLTPTTQVTQTPPSSSSLVSPTALNAAMNAGQPTNDRTGNAFVPTPPPRATSPLASSPIPSAAGAGSAAPTPFSGFGSAAPAPAPASGTGIEASTPSSFGAAVPQSAILNMLASQPGRSTPSGYVATPESMQLGANPRRRIRNAAQ